MPPGLPVRPTTDMAKEALFNVLNNHVDFESIMVLDLFAGTGNIAFEFASRGATEVLAIDTNKRCIDFIRNTAISLQFDKLTAIHADVFRFLRSCRTSFDIIFADPPYDMMEQHQIPDLVIANQLLATEGRLILEHGGQNHFDDHPAFLEKRKYGKVHFSFFGPLADSHK